MKKKPDGQLGGKLAVFMRMYTRKAQRGIEPNDRRYDMKLEKQMKRLDPQQLSRLLNDDDVSDATAP